MADVLVIDDAPDSRDVLARFLTHAGHSVRSAPNGREALRAILDQAPDVVVLDLLMPEMDGPSLLEILRSYLRLRGLPVLVWTAYPDSPVARRANALGVSATLPKAKASFADINRIIEEVLEKRPGAD
jgi:CheY-like chemotaxis protein